MVQIGGFFVCAGVGLAVRICGFSSGGVRRNLTGPISIPLEITASNNFGSAIGVYLDDPEMVFVGLGRNLLHVIRLRILDKDDNLSGVVKPTN